MKNLVLGSSGQIGGHLVNYLKQINEEVIEFDILETRDEDLRIYNNKLLDRRMKECDMLYF
ncbi:MAG: NAD-dependent epimerase/dehydratase family protein, partial [Elusimicrobiota bacterium]